MRITRIDMTGLRRFERAGLVPGPGLNLLTGDNGAGKTSVLEALHLMAYGRSFRGRVRDGLVRTGTETLEVFIEWQEGDSGRLRKAGLRHTGHLWEGRLDGAPVAHLGDLCAALAVVTFEPGSHALVTGGAETRRRLLDWGLFHVEPGFLSLWRRHARALKQRNALLKSQARHRELDAWDQELVDAGELVTRFRQDYLEALWPYLQAGIDALLPAAGATTLEFQSGWRRDVLSLGDALLLARDRDRLAGFTSVGPHRADWSVGCAGIPGRQALSRGQAKLTALALLLAQAELHAGQRGEWPIIALDDLASELDQAHQRRVLDRVRASGAQVFMTGTEVPGTLREPGLSLNLFHVEQGMIHPQTLA